MITDEIPMRDTDERIFKHHRLASSGAPGGSKMATRGAQEAPRAPQEAQGGPKIPPRSPKMAPRWSQDGAQMHSELAKKGKVTMNIYVDGDQH